MILNIIYQGIDTIIESPICSVKIPLIYVNCFPYSACFQPKDSEQELGKFCSSLSK